MNTQSADPAATSGEHLITRVVTAGSRAAAVPQAEIVLPVFGVNIPPLRGHCRE